MSGIIWQVVYYWRGERYLGNQHSDLALANDEAEEARKMGYRAGVERWR